MKKELVKRSRFLSLVLRHNPKKIGVELDAKGWVTVETLLKKWNDKYVVGPTMEELEEIVDTNDKKRFEFNEDMTKIRARQGHSIAVDVELKKTKPPEYLYHGTAVKFLKSIEATGLDKRKRNHVHLSPSFRLARTVGKRHGTPTVLRVRTEEMAEKGFDFFLSNNGVWLTDDIPLEYIDFFFGVPYND